MRGLVLGVALLAAAPQPALAAPGLEVPDPQPGPVRLSHRGEQRVGYLAVTVRNTARSAGRIAITYLPDRRADAVQLPRAQAGWIQLVDPSQNTAITTRPRIAGDSVGRIGIRVSLPDATEAKVLDGRLVLQLQRAGKPVGDPAVVRVVAARSSIPWTQIGVGAAVLGTLFAALAAWLSHRTAADTRQARLEDQLPQLFAQPEVKSGFKVFHVRNTGGGVARNVSSGIEAQGKWSADALAVFLAPGAALELPTDIPDGVRSTGVVYCWDAYGDCYVWTLEGKRYKARSDQAPEMNAEDAFQLAYGRPPKTARPVDTRPATR